jgi:hypothetical protein
MGIFGGDGKKSKAESVESLAARVRKLQVDTSAVSERNKISEELSSIAKTPDPKPAAKPKAEVSTPAIDQMRKE